MDNSDGLLPTLSELASKNGYGIEVDIDLLTVPEVTGDEAPHQSRMWLGWGDWNVIACVPAEREQEIMELARMHDGVVVPIGKMSGQYSGVALRRGNSVISAPRLESERFAHDSWMLKGIGEYVRMLRSVSLP
jgi:thiamine monophosphate kinase